MGEKNKYNKNFNTWETKEKGVLEPNVFNMSQFSTSFFLATRGKAKNKGGKGERRGTEKGHTEKGLSSAKEIIRSEYLTS